jgi:hypothetical protein
MSGFVSWKFLNESQIQQLEENLDSDSIKRYIIYLTIFNMYYLILFIY